MADHRPQYVSPLTGVQRVLDQFFDRLARYSIRHPWVVILSSLALLGLAMVGMTSVQQDNSMDSYFDASDPSYRYYKNYLEEFSSDEVIYLMYAAPDKEHGVFDMEVMKKIDLLTRTIEREVAFTRKVTSLTNVEFMYAEGDEVIIEGMLEDFPESQEELLTYRDHALSKPLYVNSLISPDGHYAAIVVEMTRTSTDPQDTLKFDPEGGYGMDNLYPQVPNNQIRDILSRPEFQGLTLWLSGDVPMNAEYNEVINADVALMTVLNLALLMPLCMFFVRKKFIGLFAPVAVVLLSIVLILGLMGWVGWSINLFFMMIPPLIIAVGVAQAIHVILAWQQQEQLGDPATALARAIGKVGTPCLLAAVTTAIGFLGMSISEMRSISELAWYTSFGIMCTFLLSMTLLIAMASFIKPKTAVAEVSEQRSKMNALTAAISRFNLEHTKGVIVFFVGLLAVSGVGISQLKIDFNFLTEFKPENQWRQHTEKINDTMGGLLSVVYVFNTGERDGIKDPQLLAKVESSQAKAKTHPIVQSTISVADIVKEINQAFNRDDPEFYRLPTDRNELSQLLLVYEVSGGEEIDDVLNLDRSKTALQIRLQVTPASQVREFMEMMDAHFAEIGLDASQVEVSGIGLLWVRMADYISSTQIKGYSIVFALIALVMMINFGSVKIGLLGMIPNLFPIAIVLGLMGWIGWDLDYMRLLLATIAIGIAVDDTIHTLTRLSGEFAETGNYPLAVERALHTVGPALIATTVILTLAFLSFLASAMAVMASFGVLLAVAIVFALIGDLFFLPALVLWLKPFGPETKPSE